MGTIAKDGHVLRFEQDWIDVTQLGGNWQYDPDWTFVDKAGHHHGYWRTGEFLVSSPFPTLKSWVDAVWMADDGDGYFDEMVSSHLVCDLCYEPIEPRRIPASEHIAGLKRWYLDDVEISAEQARAMLEASLKLPR